MHKKTLIIVGLIFLSVIIAVSGYFLDEDSKNISSSPTTPGTVNTQSIKEWKTYTDTVYGFEFKYPSHYTNFRSIPVASHQKDIYVEKMEGGGFEIKYKSNLKALASLDAQPQKSSAGELRLNIFNLNSYAISDVSSGAEFLFDTEKNQWSQNNGRSKSIFPLPQVNVGNSLIGYRILLGDAGEGFEYVLIPLKDKKLMIEIGFYRGIGTMQDIPIDTILSTFLVNP